MSQEQEGFNYAPVIPGNTFLDQYKKGTEVSFSVMIRDQIFRNESGWSVYIVESDGHRFKINGTFILPLRYGNCYKIKGTVDFYRNEPILKVVSYEAGIPEGEESVVTTLMTIEPLNIYAYQLYSYYGESIIYDILNKPHTVAKRLGVRLEQVRNWASYLNRNSAQEQAFSQMIKLGLSETHATKLISDYGLGVIEDIRANPYILIQLLENFSFKKSDQIAMNNGIAFDDENRISAGLTEVLLRAEYQHGHCFLPDSEFFQEVRKLLNISLNYKEAYHEYITHAEEMIEVEKNGIKKEISRSDLAEKMIEWKNNSSIHKPMFSYPLYTINRSQINKIFSLMLTERKIHSFVDENGEPCYMPHGIWMAEYTILDFISRATEYAHTQFSAHDHILDTICHEMGITLEEKQREAASVFTRSKGGLFILNGAAGCGKTFVLNIIIKVLNKLYAQNNDVFNVKILAPTGKAAQVAHKSTGLPASTIHREIGMFNDDSQNIDPIDAECIVIDEFSMVDILLAAKLFERIKSGTKVIILGDTEQLPSIGPGTVLRDMIESKVITTVTLNVVKRQGQNSGILENANKILEGKMISSIINGCSGDAYVMEKDQVLSIRHTLLKLFRKTVRKTSLMDVQMLCPQKKTQIGTEVMNYCIQQIINPPEEDALAFTIGKIKVKLNSGTEERILAFRKGDKVIHTKNNYKMEWYYIDQWGTYTLKAGKNGIINGEIGIIEDVLVLKNGEKTTRRIIVKYDDGFVFYDNDFSELNHAYAITIHKSQGSQWPVVLAPISSVNHIMLNKKLLYTLYTRAQSLNFIVGDRESINNAVKTNPSDLRYTHLAEVLRKKCE